MEKHKRLPANSKNKQCNTINKNCSDAFEHVHIKTSEN